MSDFSLVLQWRSVQSVVALELKGQPVADFLARCFLWLSRDRFPHSLPLSPTRFISPSSRKSFELIQMEAYPDGSWPLALQTKQSTHLASTFTLAWLSRTQWLLTIQLWPSDSLTSTPQKCQKRTPFSQSKLLSGWGGYRSSLRTCIFLLSHSGEDLSHLVPTQKDLNLNEGGWQPQAGPLTAGISERREEGRRQENDETETNIPNS